VTIQRNNQNLSEERGQRLDKLGFVWDPHQARWEEGFLHLKAYKEREGDCLVPHAHKENGYRLGQWVGMQRTNQNLSEERRQRLDKLGFVWDVRAAAWEEGLRHLKLYKERERHCRVPVSHEENGFPLGRWVFSQRQSKDRLSAERRQRLDELEFVWRVRQAGKKASAICRYKQREV
jgi:hypothetical protein